MVGGCVCVRGGWLPVAVGGLRAGGTPEGATLHVCGNLGVRLPECNTRLVSVLEQNTPDLTTETPKEGMHRGMKPRTVPLNWKWLGSTECTQACCDIFFES